MKPHFLLGLGAMGALSFSAQADLLDVLRDNGTINQQQYDTLRSENATAHNFVKSSNTNIQLVGRFYADFAHYQDDISPLASGGELRTARLEVKGSYADNWTFKAQYAFNDDSTTTRYVWLGYTLGNSIIKVGRLAPAIGISDWTSSRYTTFMERAMPTTAFAGDFAQGVEYNWWNENSGLQVSALLDTGKPATKPDADEKLKFSARYSFAPILTDSNILHLGLSGSYINPPSNTARVRTRPESHVTDTRLLDSDAIGNVNGIATGGLEAAWIAGPLSLQAEYAQREISRSTGSGGDLSFDGFYIQSSYFLTGHSRNYDPGSGSNGRTQLNGKSAIQLAIRYSTLDLTDSNYTSGEKGNNTTLGINWWPRENIKLAFNQIFAEVDKPGTANDEDIGISQVRAQIDF